MKIHDLIAVLVSVFSLLPVQAVHAYNIQSVFFRNDPIAQSILEGVNYQMSADSYFVSHFPSPIKIRATSPEYKIINALLQLGYPPEKATTPPTHALNRFQRRHNLPESAIIDKNTFILIDSELARREVLDRELAEKYPPYTKFILPPANEPTKEHLAALYSAFFAVLPDDIEENPTWSIDEFRMSLVAGLGENLGKMLDPFGIRVLTPDEMLRIADNKSDFKFCSYYYYSRVRSETGAWDGCVTPYEILDPVGAADYNYIFVLAHEYGHRVGRIQISIDEMTQTRDYFFGKISFDMSGVEFQPSSSPLRTNNDDEFISTYRPNNLEDFAESFAYYVLLGNIFKERTKTNQFLKGKYNFLKDQVFHGIEYQSGSLESFNRWISEYGTPPPNDVFLHHDPYWIWDYAYNPIPSIPSITSTPQPPAPKRAQPSDFGLSEGDLFSAVGLADPDIYIVNEHGFKRLLLNPTIFNFYDHIGWDTVKNVASQTKDAFITSGLFRNCEANDPKVYGVEITGEDTGTLHWVNMTAEAALAEDLDFFNKVFCINSVEFNWYPKGVAYTSLGQIPVYARLP